MATKERRRGHGEGAIFQRADGQWVARVTLDDGKRKTYYAKTRKEVTPKPKAAQQAKSAFVGLGGLAQTRAPAMATGALWHARMAEWRASAGRRAGR